MFLVIEIQKLSENSATVVTPIYTTGDKRAAESEFYRLCSIASVSNVLRHTVIFIEDNGYLHDCKSWDHPPEEPVEE